jgi:hypothetical protein
MAEEPIIMGDYYWDVYGNTTLHTNYNYFRKNTLFNDINTALDPEVIKAENALENLRNRELRFYNTFGLNSYKEFIEWTKDLLKGSDGQVIAKFTNKSVL